MPTPLDGTVITPMDLRAHTGEFLDRVRLQHDTFIIERRGTPMAALVPVEKLRKLRELAVSCSRHLSKIQGDYMEQQGISQEEWDREAISAVKAYRARHGRK